MKRKSSYYKRAKSDYYDDYKRNAENIYRQEGTKIRNREDFDAAYDRYFRDVSHLKKNKDWRENVYKEYTSKTTGIGIPQNYRRAVRSEDQVRRIEGRTIQQKTVTKGKRKVTYSYNIVGFQKGKLVHARKINTKRGKRFIDSRGRFVSLRK
jgi:hypothetical protein